MYLRTTKVKRSDGRVDEYIRLVESYWNNGCPGHRVVCNLGRKDLLASHLDSLIRLLRPDAAGASRAEDTEATGAWDYGPMLVARMVWRELGLEEILDGCFGRPSNSDCFSGHTWDAPCYHALASRQASAIEHMT